jgi:hypothetical protein
VRFAGQHWTVVRRHCSRRSAPPDTAMESLSRGSMCKDKKSFVPPCFFKRHARLMRRGSSRDAAREALFHPRWRQHRSALRAPRGLFLCRPRGPLSASGWRGHALDAAPCGCASAAARSTVAHFSDWPPNHRLLARWERESFHGNVSGCWELGFGPQRPTRQNSCWPPVGRSSLTRAVAGLAGFSCGSRPPRRLVI